MDVARLLKCLLISWAERESHFNLHFLYYEEAEYFFASYSSFTSWIAQVIWGLVIKGFRLCSFHACSQPWWFTLILGLFGVPSLFQSFSLWLFLLGKVLTCIQINSSLSALFVFFQLRKPPHTPTFRSSEVKTWAVFLHTEPFSIARECFP